MGILDIASRRIIERGFDYYKSDSVKNIVELNGFEFEGEVEGSQEEPYYVYIDAKHPKKSTCSCPYAAGGNVICKHMVALYFTVFEDEAIEYEEEQNINEEYYDEEDYYGYDYCNEENDKGMHRGAYFVKPLFFEEALDSYINSLSIKELKNILFKNLSENELFTYNHYLKEYYSNYLNKDKDYMFLEELNKK